MQRRPLNYNNNLGSSSTLGPAQTHVHTPPPPPPAAPAGEAVKKVDVNVGKQKNCGKTSNETKKVGEWSMRVQVFFRRLDGKLSTSYSPIHHFMLQSYANNLGDVT